MKIKIIVAMKFYDRENEIKLLNDSELLSQENAVFTVISGRRRIGKTSLILKSLENNKTKDC